MPGQVVAVPEASPVESGEEAVTDSGSGGEQLETRSLSPLQAAEQNEDSFASLAVPSVGRASQSGEILPLGIGLAALLAAVAALLASRRMLFPAGRHRA